MNCEKDFSENKGRNPVIDLIGLLKDGFENPEAISATVKIIVPEYPEQSFLAVFEDQLNISYENVEMAQADAVAIIPINVLKRIVQEKEYLDFRDPEIIGNISLEGSYSAAKHLVHACQRPTADTISRFNRAERVHQKNQYQKISNIERIYQASQIRVLEAIEDDCPIIVTGLQEEMSGGIWTLEGLKEKYGQVLVKYRSADQRLTMNDIVDEIIMRQQNPYQEESGELARPYTLGSTLPDEMIDDFGPMYFGRDDFSAPQLWLGALPSSIPASQIHRDPFCGFLYQVIGRKRLQVFSANQSDYLYPMKAYNNYQFCWYKPEAPDLNVFPKSEMARSFDVILNPGELLIQPAGWYHQTYLHDSPNMSVSYFHKYH